MTVKILQKERICCKSMAGKHDFVYISSHLPETEKWPDCNRYSDVLLHFFESKNHYL